MQGSTIYKQRKYNPKQAPIWNTISMCKKSNQMSNIFAYIVTALSAKSLTVVVCLFVDNDTRIQRTVDPIKASSVVSAIVELTGIIQIIDHASTFRNVIHIMVPIMEFFHL